MKKTKILVPALGILCLSMAASITGTVAWFSANAQVTAKGMKITASTDSSLAINRSTTGNWGRTINLAGSPSANVMPVTPLFNYNAMGHDKSQEGNSIVTKEVAEVQMYSKGKDNDVPDVNDEAAELTFASFVEGGLANPGEDTFKLEETKANYGFDTFYLKLIAADQAFEEVKLDITVTSTLPESKLIDLGLHIGLWIERQATDTSITTEASGIVYDPADEDVTAGQSHDFFDFDLSAFYCVSTPDDEGTTEVNEAKTEYKLGSSSESLGYDNWVGLRGEKYITIKMFAWYDGEDEQVTSANANIANTLTIDLAFSK